MYPNKIIQKNHVKNHFIFFKKVILYQITRDVYQCGIQSYVKRGMWRQGINHMSIKESTNCGYIANAWCTCTLTCPAFRKV